MNFSPTVEVHVENYMDIDYDNYENVTLKLIGQWQKSDFMNLDILLRNSIIGNVSLDMMETQAERLVGFYYCAPVVEVRVGPGVKQIGSSAPYNFISRFIDTHQIRKHTAFFACPNLCKVRVELGVESIGCLCFWMTPRLQEVFLGAKKISQDLFKLSKNIGKVNLEGVETIEKWCFSRNKRLENLVIPNSVKSMGASFQSCSSLKTVQLGEGLRKVSRGAFYNCKALEKITLGGSIACIAEGAFEDCSGLTEIIIPEGTTEIEPEAFLGCKSLTRVVLPQGLSQIGRDAFKGCSSLNEESLKAIKKAGYEGEI